MRVVAKSREAIERFEDIMNFKDAEFFCYRVRGFSRFGEITCENGFFSADFETDSAWSSESWFDGGDHPDILLHIGYEKRPDGTEDCNKPIVGTAHRTDIHTLAPKIGIAVELWATEPGVGFAEHATCTHAGETEYDTRDLSIVESEENEDEYEEINDFGDEWEEWGSLKDIWGNDEI